MTLFFGILFQSILLQQRYLVKCKRQAKFDPAALWSKLCLFAVTGVRQQLPRNRSRAVCGTEASKQQRAFTFPSRCGPCCRCMHGAPFAFGTAGRLALFGTPYHGMVKDKACRTCCGGRRTPYEREIWLGREKQLRTVAEISQLEDAGLLTYARGACVRQTEFE